MEPEVRERFEQALQQGRLDEATALVAPAPHDEAAALWRTEALTTLGQALSEAGQTEPALEHWRQAVETAAGHLGLTHTAARPAALLLARSLGPDEEDDAEEYLELASAITPEQTLDVEEARIGRLARRGAFDQVIARVEAWPAPVPDALAMHRLLALVRLGDGRAANLALSALREGRGTEDPLHAVLDRIEGSLTDAPAAPQADEAVALETQALEAAKAGDQTAARALIERATAARGDDPASSVLAWARCLEALNRPKAAQAQLFAYLAHRFDQPAPSWTTLQAGCRALAARNDAEAEEAARWLIGVAELSHDARSRDAAAADLLRGLGPGHPASAWGVLTRLVQLGANLPDTAVLWDTLTATVRGAARFARAVSSWDLSKPLAALPPIAQKREAERQPQDAFHWQHRRPLLALTAALLARDADIRSTWQQNPELCEDARYLASVDPMAEGLVDALMAPVSQQWWLLHPGRGLGWRATLDGGVSLEALQVVLLDELANQGQTSPLPDGCVRRARGEALATGSMELPWRPRSWVVDGAESVQRWLPARLGDMPRLDGVPVLVWDDEPTARPYTALRPPLPLAVRVEPLTDAELEQLLGALSTARQDGRADAIWWQLMSPEVESALRAGRGAQAAELAQVLVERMTSTGPSAPRAQAFTLLARAIQAARGNPLRAAEALDQALSAWPMDHPERVRALLQHARLARRNRTGREPRQLVDQAVEEAMRGDAAILVEALTARAVLRGKEGDLAGASEDASRAVQLAAGPREQARAMTVWAKLKGAMPSQLPGAVDLLEQAHDALREVLGPEHPDLAPHLELLATFHEATEEAGLAAACRRRAAALRRHREHGVTEQRAREDIARLLGQSARLREMGQLADALDALERALPLVALHRGDPSSALANLLSAMAELALEVNRSQDAQVWMSRAIGVARAALGDEHSQVRHLLLQAGDLNKEVAKRASAGGTPT